MITLAPLTRRNRFILAVSLGLGLGVTIVPGACLGLQGLGLRRVLGEGDVRTAPTVCWILETWGDAWATSCAAQPALLVTMMITCICCRARDSPKRLRCAVLRSVGNQPPLVRSRLRAWCCALCSASRLKPSLAALGLRAVKAALLPGASHCQGC